MDYVVIVRDGNNCMVIDMVNVFISFFFVVIVEFDIVICFGEFVIILVMVSGGVGGYIFVWDNGLGIGLSYIVNLNMMMIYIVIVMDEVGCIVID